MGTSTTRWGAPGTITPTPGRPATCGPLSTSSPSSRTQTGPGDQVDQVVQVDQVDQVVQVDQVDQVVQVDQVTRWTMRSR